jgi:hypothetical protein
MHNEFVVKITGCFIALLLFIAQNTPFTKKWFKNTFIINLTDQGNYNFVDNGMVDSKEIDYKKRMIIWK